MKKPGRGQVIRGETIYQKTIQPRRMREMKRQTVKMDRQSEVPYLTNLILLWTR
jgi:hypothetical protein